MPTIFAMPGTMDLLIIAAIAMLLFGNRLPSMMRNLGQGVQEFKKGVAGIEDEHLEQQPNDNGASSTTSARRPTSGRPSRLALRPRLAGRAMARSVQTRRSPPSWPSEPEFLSGFFAP